MNSDGNAQTGELDEYADVAREIEDGMKREPGEAARWRRQYELAIEALGDLAAEHAETVEELERLRGEVSS